MISYKQAWFDYKQSNDYKKSVEAMLAKGMQQPYIDNILELAFQAGFRLN